MWFAGVFKVRPGNLAVEGKFAAMAGQPMKPERRRVEEGLIGTYSVETCWYLNEPKTGEKTFKKYKRDSQKEKEKWDERGMREKEAVERRAGGLACIYLIKAEAGSRTAQKKKSVVEEEAGEGLR